VYLSYKVAIAVQTCAMTWKTILSFVLFATLLTIFVGWLTMAELLPIQRTIQYSDPQRNFIRVWLKLAISIGIILPGIAWIGWRKNSQARKILDFYLLVLIVQILTEQVSSSVGIPSLVVTIGTIYTGFRLWQLWQGQQLVEKVTQNSLSRKLMRALIWVLGLFWLSNLLMLLTLGWSSVLKV
jgi:hypothetical protein